MLMLLFRVGEELWAIAHSEVREVVPLMALQAMSQGWSDGDSPGETVLAGLLNYHGETIPVVDVSALVSGQTAEQNSNTRIVVVEASDVFERSLDNSLDGSMAEGQCQRVGLILANVSETARLKPVANIPVTSPYVQSNWQLTGEQPLVENSGAVCQLAVGPVVARVCQEIAAAVPTSDYRQMDALETACETDGFSVGA